MENPNTQYEIFVKEIYEYLHNSEQIKNINIQHNVKIRGLTGCEHQIDVYWLYEMAGIKYQVAIECKNYGGKVPIGKIRDFNSVIEDIGNINGIFVSKNGFQSGAVEYARQKKIMIKEIRYPNDNDCQGYIKNINVTLHGYSKNINSFGIEPDYEWMKNSANYKAGDTITFSGRTNENFIEDMVTGQRKSLYDLQKELDMKEEGTDFIKQFKFENTFLVNTDGEKIKIKSVTYRYNVYCSKKIFEIKGADIAKAIIKDIITGERKFISIHENVK